MSQIAKFERRSQFTFSDYRNRRLKTVKIWKLARTNTNCKLLWKNASIGQFKEHLKIGNNKIARIVGFTPNYLGFQPSRPVTATNYILFYLNMVLRRDYSNTDLYNTFLNITIQQKDVWSGGYDTNNAHLSNFFIENKSSIKLDSLEIINICRNNPWFKVPSLDFSDPSEMYSCVNYNPKAGPGLFFSKLLKQTQKKYTKVMAYALALELYEIIIQECMTNFSLWEINSREKEIKINSNKAPTTRLILNPEHHICMLLSWFFQKFMDSVSYGNNEVKFLIHKEYDGVKANKFYNSIIKNYDWVVDADWSLFDSSQDPEYIKSALLIMFSGLDFSVKANKRILFFIIESTIKKYIAIPPGIVVECNKGMPSGHPGVTAINCYVNLIRWAIIGYELYGENYWDYMDITVYGDDALVGFKHTDNLWKIDNICAKYGFIGDSIVDRLYPTSAYDLDKHSTPDFLKRRFDLNGVYWNREKLLNNLIFQTKNRSINLQIDLILGYIETGPFDAEMNEVLIKTLNTMVEFKNSLIDKEYIAKINKLNIDYQRFALFNTIHPLNNLIYENNFVYNGDQSYIREFKNDFLGLELYNAIHDFQIDELKILLKFNNNAEYLNYIYGGRKFYFFSDLLERHFTQIENLWVPNICVRHYSNKTLFNSS